MDMAIMALPMLIIFNCVMLYHVLWDLLAFADVNMDFWVYSAALGAFCLLVSGIISFVEFAFIWILGVSISQEQMDSFRVQIIIALSVVFMPLPWLIAYDYFEMGVVLEISNNKFLTFFVLWPITIVINIVAFEGLTRLVQIIARRTRHRGKKRKP